MTKKAIAPHLKKVLQDYLNNVKNADKTLLEKPFIPDTSADIVRNIEQCLISSYLLGQIHAEEENPERKINAGDGDIPPVSFAEAIDFLKARVPMTKKEWEKLEPKLRFRAFTVAKLGTAVEIETAKQVLISALEKGESYSQTWEMMNDIFGKGELGFKAGYWENVFRTNTQTAYMAGKLQQYEKTPGIAAYQLMIIEDDRTSKICRNLLTKTGRGLVLSVDDDFWKTKGFPPYHFQCRSSVRAVYQHQLKAENIKIDHPKHLDRFKPGEVFGGNPLTDGNWWKLTSSQAKIARKIGIEADLSRKEELIKMATEQIRMLNQKESGLKNTVAEILKKQPFFNEMTEFSRNAMIRQLEMFDDNKLALLKKYAGDIEIIVSNNIEDSVYNGLQIILKKGRELSDFYHEFGHHLDDVIVGTNRARDLMPDFLKTLESDALIWINNNSEGVIVNSLNKIPRATREHLNDILRTRYKFDKYDTASDILDGLTNGKIGGYDNCGSGHKKGYYSFPELKHVEGESIANITEAWYFPGKSVSEGFSEVFPNAYNMYVNFLEGHIYD